jgi:DnaK suppressor protein
MVTRPRKSNAASAGTAEARQGSRSASKAQGTAGQDASRAKAAGTADADRTGHRAEGTRKQVKETGKTGKTGKKTSATAPAKAARASKTVARKATGPKAAAAKTAAAKAGSPERTAAKTPRAKAAPAKYSSADEQAASATGAASRKRATGKRPSSQEAASAEAPAAKPAKRPPVGGAGKTSTTARGPASKSPTGHNGERRQPVPARDAGPGRPAQPGGVGLLSRRQKAPERRTEGYTDERWLNHQRHALENERATYTEQARALRAEAESLVEEMEPGDVQFDDESGEGGTVTVDRERDLALSAQALQAVEEIDHALAKMASRTYGICENCGRLIPKPRLEALPFARLCIDCKSGGLSRR